MWVPALAATWSDLGVALLVALLGSSVAALWPWLTVRQRRARFQGLIQRELQETGPFPEKQDGRPWWQHQSKRFVHEEIFARENISGNRDFILSLDPTVTYHVSQLWIAYDKRDYEQWIHHLEPLASNKHVGSAELKDVAEKWRMLCPTEAATTDHSSVRAPRMSPSPHGLFEARLSAYSSLLPLTRTDTDGRPLASPSSLMDWYYEGSNGLLLSGDALRAFLEVRAQLLDTATLGHRVRVNDSLSALRTELKIDLNVRHPDERRVELARPIERHSF